MTPKGRACCRAPGEKTLRSALVRTEAVWPTYGMVTGGATPMKTLVAPHAFQALAAQEIVNRAAQTFWRDVALPRPQALE